MELNRLFDVVVLVLGLAVCCVNAQEALLPIKQLPCPSFAYDAVYDLKNNAVTTHPNISLIDGLTGTGCSAQGVLKIAFASATDDANRRRAIVDLFFRAPNGWVFNLGDSQTNNGYAGDSGTQIYDAEVQGVGSTFTGYLSDVGNSAQTFNIANLYTTRLTLLVGDGYISWLPNNNNLYNYYYNTKFFALNGQLEPDQSKNYDLFLGLNRVIAGSYRSGSGLCKVGIKFLREY